MTALSGAFRIKVLERDGYHCGAMSNAEQSRSRLHQVKERVS